MDAVKILLLLLSALVFFSMFLCSCAQNPSANTGTETGGKYIDLHLHLDGALTLDICQKVYDAQELVLPEFSGQYSDEELLDLLTVSADCTSLNEFLECFDLPCSLLQTKEGISEAVRLVLDAEKEAGCIYAEIRFAPQKSTDYGLTQEDAVLAALDGLGRSDLKANLILCCMRGDDNQKENLETVELARKYLVKDGGVVAIDLAGAEALYPTSDYGDLFARAREYGIPFTIHAGEAAGPESILSAIEFGASRIGHGISARDNPEVLALLKEKGITVEMCPTSNLQTSAVASIDDYPDLNAFLDYGLHVTINTDDPAIEGTDISKEYELITRVMGLSEDQVNQILEYSVSGAFTTDEVKNALRAELNLS